MNECFGCFVIWLCVGNLSVSDDLLLQGCFCGTLATYTELLGSFLSQRGGKRVINTLVGKDKGNIFIKPK